MRGRLHTRRQGVTFRSIALRILLLLAVITATVLVIHFEGGLIDTRTGRAPDLLGTVYFTIVTITTVGYGDIVPETRVARMADAFFLTPIRFIVFVLFVGIAYELAFKRLQEGFLMNRAVSQLNGHVVVCGFGENGRAAVKDLLLQGIKSDQIVVLDQDTEALDLADQMDVVPVLGDASEERVLTSVAVERAKSILICPGRDDTAVLIALTALDLNPDVQLVAFCHQLENVKLLRRAGVHTIVSPAGGNLVAAATRRPHLVDTMQDMVRLSGEIFVDERRARPEEIGRHPHEIDGCAVVRVYRGRTHYNVSEFPLLESGDVLVYVATTNKNRRRQGSADRSGEAESKGESTARGDSS